MELDGLHPDATPLTLVRIPDGWFMMGSPTTERGHVESERPWHERLVAPPFYMSKYEITQAQWEAVLGYLPQGLFGDDIGLNYPVYAVSRAEIYDFLRELAYETLDDQNRNMALRLRFEWVLPSDSSKWANRIRRARQRLVEKGEMSSPSRWVWAITEKGRQRIGRKAEEGPPAPGFIELYEEYEASFRAQLLDGLSELTPRRFELFARRLLEAYGFVDVKVTGISADGGIDGYGKLHLGLASMNAAFQCRRWRGNIARAEVDKFRGAIQGEFEQGVFFVTSDFTLQANNASLKRGAVPILLLNGESIVDLMIDSSEKTPK